MPNWVINKVKFYGPDYKIKEIKEHVKTEDSVFDFETIIPMPEDISDSETFSEAICLACKYARDRGETTCEAYEKHWDKRFTFNQCAERGEKIERVIQKYGASNWYDWRINNWGTKWNSHDATWYGDDCVVFDTAWSVPTGIYEKFAKMFPDVTAEIEFADEDLGNNCGTIFCKEGRCSIDFNEDFEFACSVWGYDPDEIREEYGD